jgi:hypothetical protein
MSLESVLTGWTALDETELGRPWTYQGGKMEARYALYRTMEDAQEALMRVTATPHPESRRILALAQRAFGDLRGLLAGVGDQLLDKAPRAGEWSIREVLAHVVNVERRYAISTDYATRRTDADPMRIPNDRLPPLTGGDTSGDAAALLARLADARAETDRLLHDVAPAAMTRPSTWVHYDVDVRFRLHRFGAHIAEHTVQCEKTLAALGWRATEGRHVVRQIWSLVGELEAYGATADLSAIAKAAEARAATL